MKKAIEKEQKWTNESTILKNKEVNKWINMNFKMKGIGRKKEIRF